jgi:hypothetical protein
MRVQSRALCADLVSANVARSYADIIVKLLTAFFFQEKNRVRSKYCGGNLD